MASLGDIGLSATINILSAFAFFIAFAILRLQSFNDRIYFPKWYLMGLRTSPLNTGVKKFVNLDYRSYIAFLNWMPAALRMTEQELINHAGLDYVVYLCIYLLGSGVFNPAIVYDHLGEIYSTMIFGSFAFCVLLYIKGHLAPSSNDSGSSGNVLIDFYWGMELYPRIGKYFDIKVFTNCRFGMMSWGVLAVTYCIKHYEENGQAADSMLVNTISMLVYVTKFFWWEAGYWNSMDIAHDRAGYYICWGCMVWVPSIYTSPGMYLVNHPVHLGTELALFILAAGLLCIYINYDSDRQRQEFRRTNGKCSIWGRAPSKVGYWRWK